jgi:HD-GYP domain-containing protein (c-di-GMP phosphodiesterase class II)
VSTVAGRGILARGLDPEAEALYEESRARRKRGLGQRDRLVTGAMGAAFLAVAVPMAVLLPTDRTPGFLTVVLLVATYALLARIRFEIGGANAVPTQLVLVPMLFLLPLGWFPLCVAAGATLATLADSARGRYHPGRLVVVLVNSWFAVAPALVLALDGEHGLDWRSWPVYALALAAQFAFDFASPALRGLLTGSFRPVRLLRGAREVWLVDAALAPIGLLVAAASVELSYAFALTLPLVGLLAFFARERRTRIDAALALSHAYRGTAFLLGDVVEADDAYTGSHSRDVVDLSLAVADRLGVGPGERRDVELTALLHDVGKIRIPAEIINKPGALTPEERAVIETHTVEGERMLEQVGGMLADVGRLVRSCHERWDGGGYPDGIAGETIPLVARIVCACDAFNAMTTDRPYRAALPHDEAVRRLEESAGTQFDPRVVDALVRVVG